MARRSQEKSAGIELNRAEQRALEKDNRQRAYAFLVYEDSSYPDWMERLDAMHVEGIISPYHNQDKNPDGTDKKPHWHVLLIFQGKKSKEQINAIREKALGPNYNTAFEDIGSIRGYARYMCHMDNPEKAQYSRSDIKTLGGVDYDATIMLPSDDDKMLGDMIDYICEHNVRYFSDFLVMCRRDNPDWFSMLVRRRAYIILEFIKSEAYKAKEQERECYARGINPSTGEVIGAAGVALIEKENSHEGKD